MIDSGDVTSIISIGLVAMVNWLTVLLSALGGTAGAGLVLLGLWKFLGTVWADRLRLQIEHENNQQIEQLRAELQSQANRTQKLLDASVQKAVLVTRTQFETEFNAYKEIYAALCEVKHAIVSTRPMMGISPQDETREDKFSRLNERFRALTAAHNKSIMLKDNLSPFYSPDVYDAVDECLKASGLEIIDIQLAGDKSFTLDWFEQGRQRQEAFKAGFTLAGKLIRERISSLGIIEQG